MNKQEFLAMSLPYGLKVYVKYYNHRPDNSELETMIGIVDDCIITDMHEEDMAPLFVSNYGLCLHPLSDLTKEIEHKGETFVPIVELLKPEFMLQHGTFHWMGSFIMFNDNRLLSLDNLTLSIGRWQKLAEWHFDIADLISKGEAIDVNTLPGNPYK